jgi:hypothetical protein
VSLDCELPKLRTWVRFPSPAPEIRKIHVDWAALTHQPSLDLCLERQGFAPILRQAFMAALAVLLFAGIAPTVVMGQAEFRRAGITIGPTGQTVAGATIAVCNQPANGTVLWRVVR